MSRVAYLDENGNFNTQELNEITYITIPTWSNNNLLDYTV
jgi:hypothetical protein